MPADRRFGFRTRALHAGTPPDPATGARAQPIYLSSAFVFDSTAHATELFSLRSYGTIYTRLGNPTVAAFEEKIASLEGGLGAVATSSGQAAQIVAVLALAQSGDHLVASANLYGGTVTQFAVTLARLGIEVAFVADGDPAAMARAVTPRTKALYAETIGNPRGAVADIGAMAQAAHAAGVPLIIDNTFASPYLCRPIEHGADIVLHSGTKYICGHGTVMAGVVVDAGTFAWAEKHQLITQPSPGYHGMNFRETFGEYAFLLRARAEVLRDLGCCLSPMDAWLLIQGLESLAIRVEAQTRNARAVADFLAQREEVAWVRYAGLPDDPEFRRAQRYLPVGAGAILTFGLRGGRPAAVAFIEALQLWSHVANVGDVKSLVIHPASTTHSQLTEEEMAAAGVGPDMVRLSVGLEDVDDLLWDLSNGLQAAHGAALAVPTA
ncbi:MAG: O-acetylhomoserine aminocarboxypropyltransferase/cysteine synthase [Candidatus Eremiobacteraeota bacterium]|nr:O-acetylhomoserine aminocarboxypropyltransferase/cysteine synthase [Candidatus Eremiobacteraeota bacterium]MBC5826707.1 O-acetylhomoserine aminocarboxypropyltransferase/cysteine synthase [Candidatus Eremiobacteraeota bacterium]